MSRHKNNQKHFDNPEPGDHWHEMFLLYTVPIINLNGNHDEKDYTDNSITHPCWL